MYNAGFAAPLDQHEVAHVARSVAKWTHQHLDAASFSAWQAAQGSKKGKSTRDHGKALLASGATVEDVMQALGVSRATVFNWKRPV